MMIHMYLKKRSTRSLEEDHDLGAKNADYIPVWYVQKLGQYYLVDPSKNVYTNHEEHPKKWYT